jgi:hypothetical protein
MSNGFDKLVEDFEKEILKEGLFTDLEKHKMSKFIGLNKSKTMAAIKLYKELESAKKAGHYDRSKSPLVVAAEIIGMRPRILAYELKNQGLVDESILEQYLNESADKVEIKVASLEDFIEDVYLSGSGSVTYSVLDNGDVEYTISISEKDSDAGGRYATMKTKPSGYLKGQKFVG